LRQLPPFCVSLCTLPFLMKFILPAFWLLLFVNSPAVAQFAISAPCSRAVYQRDSTNRASVFVSGMAPPEATKILARFVPAVPGQGVATQWKLLSFSTTTLTFQGAVMVAGGWYRLDVRALTDTDTLSTATIDRVGVGEVFVVAGQSNAFGITGTAGATDDRVSVIDFKDDNLNEQLLPLSFSHADVGVNVGPSNPLHIWATLGDRLVKQLGVPVLFLGAAQPATDSQQWQQSAAGLAPVESLLPYRRLGAVLLHYVSRTGIRAVLWHQGEGDTGRGEQQYVDNVSFVIQKSRQQLGLGQIPWVMSRVSYVYGATSSATIRAQNRLIAEVPGVFAGPQTDDLTGADMRPDGVHFKGQGLVFLEELWYQRLNADFFARSRPISAPVSEPNVTTGYVLPNTKKAGEQFWVPFVPRGPFGKQPQFRVQLLRSDNQDVVTESAYTTQNPIPFTVPATVVPGDYRLRVIPQQAGFVSNIGEVIHIKSAQTDGQPTVITPILTNLYGGTSDTLIRRIGYQYDAQSHGFNLLISATNTVEARLERIDGGYFGDTNWAKADNNTSTGGSYNYIRPYLPAVIGIGGVEVGRYRLSVRLAGNKTAGQWVEVSLLGERNTVYSASDSATTVQYVRPLKPGQPGQPVVAPIGETFRQGTSDSESGDWQLWPNPTANELIISLPISVNASLLRATVTTLAGISRPVSTDETTNGQLRLTLGDLPTGLYFVHVSDHAKTLQTWRVLKR
jgi:Carbohydrate esterase, sialic acid-specific acetylesterase